MEGIVRDMVHFHPEAKPLFGVNDCSLHGESLSIFDLLREPAVLELTA